MNRLGARHAKQAILQRSANSESRAFPGTRTVITD
jgi:hypothetical protein